MDTADKAIERCCFIFGYDGDGQMQDRQLPSATERRAYRWYIWYCSNNSLPEITINRPHNGMVAVEIDRIFCPEKNCSGHSVPVELEQEYYRLIGFFARCIMDPRNVKPVWSIAEDPISTFTFFELPEHKLWQTLPHIIRFAKETLVFQRCLMEAERGGG